MTASHAHGGRRARRRAVIRAAPPHGRAEPAMHELAAWFGRTLGEFRRRRVFRVAAAYLVFGWLLLQVADVNVAVLVVFAIFLFFGGLAAFLAFAGR